MVFEFLPCGKRYQWKGACMEPFPGGFQQHSCQLFVNAMSDTDGKNVDFSVVGQEYTMDDSRTKQNNSLSSKQTIRRGKSALTVTTISFPTLLKQSNAPSFIDFISLDVEGHEYTVLSKFSMDKL